jgi:hypothetical protein
MLADYNRLLQTAMREFEKEVVQQVEAEFARVLAKGAQPDEEIPFIGGEFPPPQYRDGLKERVMRALLAQKWFEFEAPRWAWPLPIREEDSLARRNAEERWQNPRQDHRYRIVADYAESLRGLGWHYERILPFEIYCAHCLRPPE